MDRSARSAGLAANDDFNGETQLGAGSYQATCHRGRRWSTASAFLGAETLSRANLSVLTGALATRVIVEGTRAIGLTYLLDGATTTAWASAEIVLSGGAINSPQLLMLSGIGPGHTWLSTASRSRSTCRVSARTCTTTPSPP